MTRRWAATIVAVLALTGCADSDAEPTDVPVPATGATSSPSSSASGAGTTTARAGGTATAGATGGTGSAVSISEAGSNAFVAVVRDKLPEIAADRRDEEIAELARQACVELAKGTGADRLVAGIRSLGTLDAEATDQATARELIKLAIDKACPGQANRVDEF